MSNCAGGAEDQGDDDGERNDDGGISASRIETQLLPNDHQQSSIYVPGHRLPRRRDRETWGGDLATGVRRRRIKWTHQTER